jgi:predicted nucleotidyltransferase
VPEAVGPFSPVELLGVLVEHGVDFILIGGLGATVHGSPYATVDVDIVPRQDRSNLDLLSNALRALGARVYVSAEETLRFDHNGSSLADVAVWNLATSFGGLDISYVPAGTTGYSDLAERAQSIDIGGVVVRVAALEDVIRSKEAANREKDRVVLPALRRLLERSSEHRSSPADEEQR